MQYPRGVRARLGAIASLRRAFAARSLFRPLQGKGAGGTPSCAERTQPHDVGRDLGLRHSCADCRQ